MNGCIAARQLGKEDEYGVLVVQLRCAMAVIAMVSPHVAELRGEQVVELLRAATVQLQVGRRGRGRGPFGRRHV